MSTLAERAPNVGHYTFEPARLDSDTFQVVRFEGTERISEPFVFRLHLVSRIPDIDFAEVVNHRATFTMRRGSEDLPIHGLVTDFSQRGRSSDYVSYHATLRPRLKRLDLNYRSRIFQDVNVPEILQSVLEEGGLSSSDFRFELNKSYPTREYCVQYEESDLHFIHRLTEVEGIYYFFEHRNGRDEVVVTDQKSEHTSIPAPTTLRYHDGAGGMVDQGQETIDKFVVEEQVVPGAVRLRDYDPKTPETVTAKSEVHGEMPGTRYEYGRHFASAERGSQLAEVQSEALGSRRRTISGRSDSSALRSGFLFTLEQHFRKDLNGDYLVTQVEHEGSQREGLPIDARETGDAEPSSEPEYCNRFICIPASVQYRSPHTTEKPEVPGVVTATVESAGGDYAYIDDQGRYRAKLHFDRRDDRSDGTNTLPIRMTQPYSGPDYGMHFPNHADTELLIAFENGDIDRPIALGTTPNPSNSSPTKSENRMENILRTFGGNELLMDDTKEETRVKINSANAHQLLFDDKKEKIELVSTDNHRVLLDDKKKRIEVQSKKGRKILLDDDKEVVSVTSKNGHVLQLSDKKDRVTVTDADENHVLTLDYKNEKMSLVTKGDIGLEAEGAIEMKSKSLSIETDQGVTFDVGGDLTQEAKGNASLEAKGDTSVKAGKAFTGEGGTKVDLSAQEIAQSASVKVDISGAKVAMEGSAMAEVKGGVLKLNG